MISIASFNGLVVITEGLISIKFLIYVFSN